MEKFKLKFVWFLLPIFIFVQIIGLAFAADNFDLTPQKINPGSFYYPFKRLWEKIRERLIFSNSAKIKFYQSLSDKRLSELNYLVENNVLSEVERGSQRFAFQVGVLTQVTREDSEQAKRQILDRFEKYNGILEKLRDKYPANTSFWLLIQHDINTLKILSENLK